MIRNRLMMCITCILLIAQDCSSDAKKENQCETLRIVRIEAPVTGEGELFSDEIHSSGYLLSEGSAEDTQFLLQSTGTQTSMIFNQIIQDDDWGTSSINNGVEDMQFLMQSTATPNSMLFNQMIQDDELGTSSISNGIETISLITYTMTPPNSPIPPNPINDIVLSTQFSIIGG